MIVDGDRSGTSAEERENLIGEAVHDESKSNAWESGGMLRRDTPLLADVLTGLRNAMPTPKSFSLRAAYSWPPPESTRDTAWLDGLRGVAAFFVMTYHFTLDWWFALYVEAPYGALETVSGEIHWWDLWRLPIIRIPFTSGHTQVSVFFVLSGFVLSWGPLSYIRANRSDKLAQSLGSATFRRWIRLYLPCFAVAFFEFLELRSGWRPITNKERMASFWAQLWDFIWACDSYANPFTLDRNNWNSLHPYDWTMWTIPYEFAGSLCIFLVLLAVARIQSYRKRALVVGFISLYAAFEAKWSYWLFISGTWIADHVKECGGFEQIARTSTPTSRLRWGLVFLVGLLFAGNPEPSQAYTRPGYSFLDNFVPYHWELIEGGGRLWWNIGGILILLGACHLPSVQHFFSRPTARYLGRISFMVYITHRVILNGVGLYIKRYLFALFGRDPFIDQPRAPGLMHPLVTFALWLTLMAIHLPLCVFVANWCEILIDAPSTKFARWIDEQFVTKTKTDIQDRSEAINLLPVAQDANREGINGRKD